MHIEKCKMTFARLLIIACLLQEFELQLIIIDDQCSLEEILTIRQRNQDWLDENVKSLDSFSEHKLTELRERMLESFESSPVTLVLRQIDSIVGSLKSGECVKQLQTSVDLQKVTLTLLQDKCVLKSRKKETSFEKKADSVLAKMRSAAKKADIALQKCALKNGFGGCSEIENCSQLVVLQLVEKIESSKYKIDSSGEKLVSEQNACLKNVANKALTIKEDIEREVLECSLQGSGTTESDETTEADMSNKSSESNESTEESLKNDSTVSTESIKSNEPDEPTEHNSSHSSESTEEQHSVTSEEESTNRQNVSSTLSQSEITTTDHASEETEPTPNDFRDSGVEKVLETDHDTEQKSSDLNIIQSDDQNDVQINNQSDDENHLKSS